MSRATVTLALAHILARSHAEAGLIAFNALQQLVDDPAKLEGPQGFTLYVRHGVPAVTSSALAAELFLKVIASQHSGQYPRDHDLVKIYEALPTATRRSLAERYAEHYKRDVPRALHFALSAGDGVSPPPEARAVPFPDLPQALAHLRDAFVSWRYIFETMDVPAANGVNLKALFCLIEAADAEILAHQGDLRIQLSRGPGSGVA